MNHPELRGPVELELVRGAEQVPSANSMPGGESFEMKFDGFRLAAVRRAGAVRLWSRQGKELTARFPDVQDAWRRDELPS